MNTTSSSNQPTFNLLHIEETHSTNNYLTELCNKEDLAELSTVVANYQTSGRGQRGNSWESERGKNLLFSFVLYPDFIKIKQQFIISQLVSLAIIETLNTFASGFSIKWPNDIYWKEKKIAGILIENDLIGDKIGRCIVGIGLNINQTSFVSDAPNPISLQQIIGEEAHKSEILHTILDRIRFNLLLLKEGNAADIKSLYMQHLFRGKGKHYFKERNSVFRAHIQGVNDDGLLILVDESEKERGYYFKEVSFIL